MKPMAELVERTFERCLATIKKKNADYAGDSSAGPFKNFIDPELQEFLDKGGIDLDAVELGIRTRLKDKWARLNTLLFSGGIGKVEESMDDTIEDMISYLAIWQAWRMAGKEPWLWNNAVEVVDEPTIKGYVEVPASWIAGEEGRLCV